ncbi:UDP-glucose 4-epimerase GalE [Streptomyces sp. G3]|uniref:UDP-glucose 4-epimerase n=1 Tax=Streptomyces salinarius TaxID=2762598 RepID=A0ABW8BE15_9ACTN|nr:MULTISPECIES: UDP-glucose 4-epimerase GalE [unclassified Streptomyces]MCM1943279.1 UDP-glucose 4-epimerase GalE [Streptomyces sp. G3]NDZ73563.1 UDP-glucose 4-epimerase GalE [Streptomyces sp. SID10362]QUW88851.1 UDP-glucose 4-epimerase [Streptomyces sp. V17-9]WKX23268.1 UDP-glucose 4-epimerase GalE [Streptomyces sp. HUAS CX7]
MSVTSTPKGAAATVLVTGGAGFIGSHACVELLDHGYEVIVVDDHSHSSPQVFRRVERVAGRFVGAVYELDIRDRRALSAVFDRHRVDAVVHFAAHKAVGESTRMPVQYYDNNVGGTTSLLLAMRAHDVRRLVFSSSCSVYGDARGTLLDESAPARPTNPYAASKWLCERVLADVCRHWPDLAVLCLRYFNPTGAHPSGLLGESPDGEPDNLMPYVSQVAIGRRDHLRVFGGDYPTPDGTAIRDYLHVMDTVEAHRVALDHLADRTGMRIFNLGSGHGSSVLDVVRAFSAASGRPIPYDVVGRRPGDVPELVADARAVARAWGWRPTRDLAAMCRDAWHFQKLNPHGYAGSARRPGTKE